MELDEAAAVLGIDGDLDERGLRRAYLKKVRAYPPERHPEQFQRVREAYETLQQVVEAGASLPASAIAELDSSPLPDAQRADGAVASFIEYAQAQEAELAEERGDSPLERLRTAVELLERGDKEAALDVLVPLVSSDEATGLPGHDVIDALLLAYQLASGPRVPRAFAKWRNRLRELGLETQVIDHAVSAQFVAAAELMALPMQIPGFTRSALAAALRERDGRQAQRYVSALARRDPAGARAMSEYLTHRFPALAHVFGETLRADWNNRPYFELDEPMVVDGKVVESPDRVARASGISETAANKGAWVIVISATLLLVGLLVADRCSTGWASSGQADDATRQAPVRATTAP